MIVGGDEARWCSGMRSDGVRTLAPEERDALATLRRSHARRAIAAGWVLPSLAILVGLTLELAPNAVAGAIVCVSGGLIIPAALLFGGESLVAWRALARDVEDPRVETFVGAPVPGLVQDPTIRALLRRGALASPVSRLEVLVGSCLPWSADGERVRELRPLRIVTVAGADEAGAFERRALTERERVELRARAVREERMPMLGWYLGGIAAIWAVVITSQGASAALEYGWRPLVALGLGAATVGLALARRMRADRLRADERGGVVILGQTGAPRLEVLPESGLVWTVDGAPAPHRTH